MGENPFLEFRLHLSTPNRDCFRQRGKLGFEFLSRNLNVPFSIDESYERWEFQDLDNVRMDGPFPWREGLEVILEASLQRQLPGPDYS